MRTYAIVGGIGAGKSTVARALARGRGARLDVDRIGHGVLRLERVKQRLLATFPPDIVGPDGVVDRRRLGRLVFGNATRLRRLEAIVHPEIARRVRARLAAWRRRGVRVAILDAALFFELDLDPVDGVLVVTAPRSVRRARLQAQRGLSAAEAEARLRSQPRLAAWTRRADVRIDTDCSRLELRARIERAWRELRRRRRRSTGRGTT
jgi:dephospho-CoA kinase